MERGNILNRYVNVIREQFNEGIVERVSGPPVGKEFYISHKTKVRESAESTKLRIVYDASARASEKAPSLNECLHVGPPLQNKLWAVLVLARFRPVALTGEMKQAFLQVRIREEDRDNLQFHWISDLETKTSGDLSAYKGAVSAGTFPISSSGCNQAASGNLPS